MQSETIAKAFSSPTAFREFIAFIGGILLFGVLNLRLEPAIQTLPNADQFGANGKLLFLIIAAYATGQVMLWFGHQWVRAVGCRLHPPSLSGIREAWRRVFIAYPGARRITIEDKKKATVNPLIDKFIHEHGGLMAEHTRHLVNMYFARIFVSIAAALLAIEAWRAWLTLDWTYFLGVTFWLVYGLLLLATVHATHAKRNQDAFEINVFNLFEDVGKPRNGRE